MWRKMAHFREECEIYNNTHRAHVTLTDPLPNLEPVSNENAGRTVAADPVYVAPLSRFPAIRRHYAWAS